MCRLPSAVAVDQGRYALLGVRGAEPPPLAGRQAQARGRLALCPLARQHPIENPCSLLLRDAQGASLLSHERTQSQAISSGQDHRPSTGGNTLLDTPAGAWVESGNRAVAQPGSALEWGSSGRPFKSGRPDQAHWRGYARSRKRVAPLEPPFLVSSVHMPTLRAPLPDHPGVALG